jgi:hypothetical protein
LTEISIEKQVQRENSAFWLTGFFACTAQLGNEVERAFLWRVPAAQAVYQVWRGVVINPGGWRKQL